MIEIKCDELQKEAIKQALLFSEFCIIDNNNCRNDSCSKCLEKNINWIIEEGE